MDSKNLNNNDDIKYMIKKFCYEFEYKYFKFISFAFTKYYRKLETKEKLNKIKEDFIMEIKQLIKNYYGQKEFSVNLPYFFTDSDIEESDEDSSRNFEQIYQWAKGLPPFNIKEL